MGLARSMFERTVKPPYVLARAAAVGALERRAGISTAGHLTPEELGFDGAHRQRYQPTHWFALRRILPPREVGPQDVFVDFGSGMGRVVYQAAAGYPFARVAGVELSEQLHRIAEQNIERTRPRLRCQDVQLVCGDVLAFEIPDDLTVAFLANPFGGHIFQAVVDGLVASLVRRPRRLRVVYVNPVEEQRLLDAGWREVRRLRGLRPGREWARSNDVRLYERG
ncbi:MAG TPA: methyltransferase domain-containing protein [Baekduia sp.]|nr:methyltransferase domain-containing protein [Baekduia sp.]